MSTRCKDHALYLRANRKARGPEEGQREVAGAKGASSAGNLFANMAIVSTARDPKKALARWMSWPGYRDAILNNRLARVGIYADGSVMVMHTVGGTRKKPRSVPLMLYPMANQKAVPTQVPVKELGWDVRKLLEDNGHQNTKVLGFPLSMHLGAGVGHYPQSFKCQLSTQGDPVPGLVHLGPKGSNRRDSAPGIVVFYPLRPLKRGTQYQFRWTWDRKVGGARQGAEQKGGFTTR